MGGEEPPVDRAGRQRVVERGHGVAVGRSGWAGTGPRSRPAAAPSTRAPTGSRRSPAGPASGPSGIAPMLGPATGGGARPAARAGRSAPCGGGGAPWCDRANGPLAGASRRRVPAGPPHAGARRRPGPPRPRRRRPAGRRCRARSAGRRRPAARATTSSRLAAVVASSRPAMRIRTGSASVSTQSSRATSPRQSARPTGSVSDPPGPPSPDGARRPDHVAVPACSTSMDPPPLGAAPSHARRRGPRELPRRPRSGHPHDRGDDSRSPVPKVPYTWSHPTARPGAARGRQAPAPT